MSTPTKALKKSPMQFVDDASSTDSDTLVASSESSAEEDDLKELCKKFVRTVRRRHFVHWFRHTRCQQ
jgi:methylmalonyl-CoA mutase cobalamin-binding subunit